MVARNMESYLSNEKDPKKMERIGFGMVSGYKNNNPSTLIKGVHDKFWERARGFDEPRLDKMLESGNREFSAYEQRVAEDFERERIRKEKAELEKPKKKGFFSRSDR